MFYRTFLIKYGEIGIKGKTRNVFEDALVDQIRRALGRLEGSFRVWKEQGRVIIDVEGEEDSYDYDELIEALQRVFGIVGQGALPQSEQELPGHIDGCQCLCRREASGSLRLPS